MVVSGRTDPTNDITSGCRACTLGENFLFPKFKMAANILKNIDFQPYLSFYLTQRLEFGGKMHVFVVKEYNKTSIFTLISHIFIVCVNIGNYNKCVCTIIHCIVIFSYSGILNLYKMNFNSGLKSHESIFQILTSLWYFLFQQLN